MKMTKRLAAGAACVVMVGLLAVPVSAHGNRCHSGKSSTAACTVDGCQENGTHYHNGVTYCGHTGSGTHHRGHC